MTSRTSSSGGRRLSWRRTGAIAFSVALHVCAFLLVIAPITPPQAKVVVNDDVAVIHMIKSLPPEPAPPALPEPPQPPQEITVVKSPTPELSPSPQPRVATEARSPMAEVASPPQPPEPARQQIDFAPSTDITYKMRNKPPYPAQAVRMRHEGAVVLLVLVGLDGNPKEIKVEQSSGYRELDLAAIKAARGWRFHPGSRGGVPYVGWARVPVDFQINQF